MHASFCSCCLLLVLGSEWESFEEVARKIGPKTTALSSEQVAARTQSSGMPTETLFELRGITYRGGDFVLFNSLEALPYIGSTSSYFLVAPAPPSAFLVRMLRCSTNNEAGCLTFSFFAGMLLDLSETPGEVMVQWMYRFLALKIYGLSLC